MSRPLLYAVTGRPILHSLSPAVFAAAFAELGVDAGYTRLAADSAGEVLTLARRMGLAGLNVTAPFKEGVVPLLDGRDDAAERIGAVNTIVMRRGEAHGTNTDPDGIHAMLREADLDPHGCRAAIIGAGGAARAALYALIHAGVDEVAVINRGEDRGRRAADDLGGRFVPMAAAQAVLVGADVVVSTLPPGAISGAPTWMRSGQIVLDACYHDPPLAAPAAAAGCRYVGGATWLLGQAAAVLERFTGRPAPLEAMRRALDAGAGDDSPGAPVLLGTEGTRKTRTQDHLATLLGGGPPGPGRTLIRLWGDDPVGDTGANGVADLTIGTDNRSAEQVAQRIVDEIRRAGTG